MTNLSDVLPNGRYGQDDIIVSVSSRKDQRKLLWGTIKGFFKGVPVDVYQGHVELMMWVSTLED